MNFSILIFILSLNFSGSSQSEVQYNRDTHSLLEPPKKKPTRPRKIPTTTLNLKK